MPVAQPSSKDALYVANTWAFLFLLGWVFAGCGNGDRGGGRANGSNASDAPSANGDATIETGSDDSGLAPDVGDAKGTLDGSPEGNDMGTTEGGGMTADSGGSPSEGGGAAPDGGTDGDSGFRDIGSCCAQQSTPGCSNASLEVCVCEKDPSCCTTAWGPACVLIVQQKYCQPGVRDCVCGTDAGQWGQTDCCNTDWTSTCDSVATLKCNAAQGCF